MRKAILQIGTEKTGSTTLQAFLATNRDRLVERGFIYPRFCGEINHTGLAAFAMEADRQDALKHPYGGADAKAVPEMRAQLRQQAKAELSNELTALFCNEHCHSRLTEQTEVIRMRDFLSEFFDDIQVCVYLRRQDQVALSLYSTTLKSGGTPDRILPQPHQVDPYYNYDLFLSLWEPVFGRDNITVRVFEREALLGGSVVDDFLDHWQIGAAKDFLPVSNQNGSITPGAQEFLRLANPHLMTFDGQWDEALCGPIVSALTRCFPGRGLRPSRAEALAFYQTYCASNTAVAARYFPERATLFSEDFSSYPEQDETVAPDVDIVAKVAATLLKERCREIDRLEAEIAIRDARLHWRDDNPEATTQGLRDAIKRFPQHAGLNRSLGEYLLRLNQPKNSVPNAEAACVLAPKNWEFHHFLGVVRLAAGDPKGAAAAQAEALALNPDHPGVQRELELALGRCQPNARHTA